MYIYLLQEHHKNEQEIVLRKIWAVLQSVTKVLFPDACILTSLDICSGSRSPQNESGQIWYIVPLHCTCNETHNSYINGEAISKHAKGSVSVSATFWSHYHVPGSHQASLAKVESLFQSGAENNLFGAQREVVKAAKTLVLTFMMLCYFQLGTKF